MPVVQANNQPYSGTPTVEPSVETPSRYQTETATPAAFGGAVAGAVSGLGRDIGAAANTLAQTQDFINKVNADDLTNKYMEAINKIEFGDPDKGDTGFVGKKGQDAISAFPAVRDQLGSIRTQLATGLNPGARILFDSETRRMQNYAMTRLGAHFDQEFNSHALEVSKAKVDNGLTAAAHAISQGDDAGFESSVGAAMRGAIDGLKLKGLDKDPDVVNNTLQKIRGDAVKYKAEAIAQKDPDAAQTFLQNNNDAMERDEFNTLMSRYRAQAQNIQADRAWQGMPIHGSGADRGSYSGNSNDAVEHFLDLTRQDESRGRNIVNFRFDPTHTAQGYYQITNTTWRSFASGAGVDLKQYPTAMSAPEDIQRQVARHIVTTSGVQHWTSFNSTLLQHAANAGLPTFGPIYADSNVTADQPKEQVAAVGGRLYAHGDSIAAQMQDKAGAGGRNHQREIGNDSTAVWGWGPSAIANLAEHAPESSVKGKDIVLSSGASNVATPGTLNQNNQDLIAQTIQTYYKRGAKSVTVLGVGEGNKDIDLSGRNGQLAQISAANGAAFAGALGPTVDGIHPKNAAQELQKAQAARDDFFSKRGPKPPIQLASSPNAPDQMVGQPAQTMPKLNFMLPPLDPGELPDNQVPGMAQALENIQKTVPEDNVLLRQKAVQAARRSLNGQYQDQQRQLRLHTEQTKAQSEARMDQYIQRLDSGSPPAVQEIDQDQYLTPKHKRTMRTMVLNESKVDPLPAINSKNTTDLFARIHQQPGTEGKISDPEIIAQSFANKEINESSYKFLTNELKDRRDASGELINNRKKELLDSMKPSIYGPMASTPEGRDMDAMMAIKEGRPSADQRYYNYLQFVNTKMGEYQKAGKNPHDLFDPTKPDFVGKPEILKEYASPMAARLQQTPAAQPGFLGRIFGGVNPLEQLDQSALRGYAAQSPEAYDAAVKELQRRAAQGAK